MQKKKPQARVNHCITSAWKERTAETHDLHMKQLDTLKNPDIVLLGSSLIERWKTTGKEKWQILTSKHKILNAGVGGDKTQNVIWRLEHGLFNTIKPRLVVLMIGGNNIEKDSIEYINQGILKIIQMIHEKSPDTKFAVYGLLPRVDFFDKTLQLNNFTKISLSTLEYCTYYDINEHFIESEKVKTSLYDDKVHINAAGFNVWFQHLDSIL